MPYRDIRGELARNDMTISQMAERMELSTTSLSDKLNGKKKFWLHEAKRMVDIFNELGCNYTIEQLFGL